MFWCLRWRDLPSLIWFSLTYPMDRPNRTCPLCLGHGTVRR